MLGTTGIGHHGPGAASLGRPITSIVNPTACTALWQLADALDGWHTQQTLGAKLVLTADA